MHKAGKIALQIWERELNAQKEWDEIYKHCSYKQTNKI